MAQTMKCSVQELTSSVPGVHFILPHRYEEEGNILAVAPKVLGLLS